ncbi:MAG TPA: hypothetical protein VM509_13230 [Planctomycetota bacterium]|nr:hypothetical protein [Planctomycetota bacterium]
MRVVIRLVAIALVLLLLLGVAAALFLDRGARIAVEKGVTYALAVPTSAGSVSIRPLQGSVALSKLDVANPAGFSESKFLTLGNATVHVRIGSLMGDVVEVPKLELDGIHLRLEGRGLKTNYGAILDNLKRHGGGEKKEPDAEEQGTQKRFIVHDLLIRDTQVEGDFTLDSPLGQLANTKGAVTLPEIHLTELGNGESLSLPELTEKILRALLEAAASGNVPGFSGDVAKDLKNSLSGLEEKAKGLEKDFKDVLEGFGKKKPSVEDPPRSKQ